MLLQKYQSYIYEFYVKEHYNTSKTYFNMPLLDNLRPVLRSKPIFPNKINENSYRKVEIGWHRKTSSVITSLSCSKCKITGMHTIPIVKIVPIRWTHLATNPVIQSQYMPKSETFEIHKTQRQAKIKTKYKTIKKPYEVDTN